MEIKIPYYEDRSRISNSSLGWFINYGPTYFRLMLDGTIKTEETSAMTIGSIIHMWLLQNDKFWDEYRLYQPDERRMSPNAKAFCEALVNTTELEHNKAIINAYRSAYSTKDLSDEKVLEKGLELATELSNYILDLRSTDTRNKIGEYQLQLCKDIESNVRNHKLANELLFATSTESFHTFNEFHINWDFPKEYYDQKVECKSLIDRWTIDYEKKVITLIDLKTTVNAYDFHNSVEKYQYYRQLAFYWCAIFWYMRNEMHIDVLNDEWEFKTYIVATQTNNGNTVRVFEMSANIIDNYSTIIANVIKDIAWHLKNNLWDHTVDYYEGNGSEQLKAA